MMGLELRGVAKAFGGAAAVEQVSLAVPQGQLVCFLGPSGCGKTTLLRIIAGLETPTAGQVLFNGRDITALPVHQRNFAMVFQSLALFPHLTVAENIAYSLRLRGLDARGRAERVAELLALIRLPDIGGRAVSQLSGGQRQRVAIARALAQEPALFLMDEPLSALDARLRDHMQVELRQLQQRLRITAVLVTHDQREAMTMADLVVVMGQGRVQQVGPPLEIYRNPANRFVAEFIGQSNLLDAEVADGGHVVLGGRRLGVGALPGSARVGDRVTLSVRPESVQVSARPENGADGGTEAGADGTLPGRVTFVRDVGSLVELHVHCAGREIVCTTGPGQVEWASNAPVSVRLPPDACHVLLQ